MKTKKTHQYKTRRRSVKHHSLIRSGLVLSLILGSMVTTVWGGQISGWVGDDQGNPLQRVSLCLTHESTGRDCIRVRATDKNGNYRFKPLKKVGNYAVEILTDSSVKGRRANLYPNFVWDPPQIEVIVNKSSDVVENVNFTGTFNFSNFHSSLTLTSEDFPELADFDLQTDYVFLKVYTIDGDPLEGGLIFLGQVRDPQNILIEASVPLSVVELQYQIFSPTKSVTGTISITSTEASGPGS
jgi:hypothetical protein